MRSRYAAYALNLGAYLVRTLASTHEDKALPQPVLVAALSRPNAQKRFADLRIIFASEEGDAGEVLFFARIYDHGRDVSFAELSTFVREDGGWRYARGITAAPEQLPKRIDTMTREAFLALAAPSVASTR